MNIESNLKKTANAERAAQSKSSRDQSRSTIRVRSKAVLRMRKVKTALAISQMQRHNLREDRDLKNVDYSKSHLNREFVQFSVSSFDERIAHRMKSCTNKTVRKDAVRTIEFVLSASPEYFRPQNPSAFGEYEQGRLDAWIAANFEFLKKEHGDNLVSAVLHLDEATPHIHAVVVPLDAHNRLNAKHFFGGRQKLSETQTRYAAAVAHLGIERGDILQSPDSHTSQKSFYRASKVRPLIDPPRILPPPVGERPSLLEWSKLREFDTQLEQHKQSVIERNRYFASLYASTFAENAKIKTARENARKMSIEAKTVRLAYESQKREIERIKDISLVDVMLSLNAIEHGTTANSQTRVFLLNNTKISVTPAKSLYIDAAGKGGKGSINLVMHALNVDFKTACQHLSTDFAEDKIAAASAARAIEFAQNAATKALSEIPAACDKTLNSVILHLQNLGIPRAKLDELIRDGKLRSDTRQNAVFVRSDAESAYVHGTCKTRDGAANTFKKSIGGGVFSVGQNAEDLIITDSAEDAIALSCFHPDALVVASEALTPVAFLQLIKDAKSIKLAFARDGQTQQKIDSFQSICAHRASEYLPPDAKNWLERLAKSRAQQQQQAQQQSRPAPAHAMTM